MEYVIRKLNYIPSSLCVLCELNHSTVSHVKSTENSFIDQPGTYTPLHIINVSLVAIRPTLAWIQRNSYILSTNCHSFPVCPSVCLFSSISDSKFKCIASIFNGRQPRCHCHSGWFCASVSDLAVAAAAAFHCNATQQLQPARRQLLHNTM